MIDLSLGIDPHRLAHAVEWAHDAYTSCRICPEACGVNRHAGELGVCGLGSAGRVYKEYLHYGEEAVLTPSHTIYTTGCNFRCAFCSDMGAVSEPSRHGSLVAPEALARRIAKRREEGATNVNFVGGLPDVNVLFILQVLTHCPRDTHVVFNTNLWTSEEAIKVLEGVVSTWLVDLKFGSDACAKKLAGIDGYVARFHDLLGVISEPANLLMRHLLMPGHLACCTRPALERLASERPGATLNLMTGYHPFRLGGAKTPMGGALSPTEREQAIALAHRLDLTVLLDGRRWSAHDEA